MTKEEAEKKAEELNKTGKAMLCPMNLLRECVGIKCAWFVRAYAKMQYKTGRNDLWMVFGDASCSVTYLACIGENQCPMI